MQFKKKNSDIWGYVPQYSMFFFIHPILFLSTAMTFINYVKFWHILTYILVGYMYVFYTYVIDLINKSRVCMCACIFVGDRFYAMLVYTHINKNQIRIYMNMNISLTFFVELWFWIDRDSIQSECHNKDGQDLCFPHTKIARKHSLYDIVIFFLQNYIFVCKHLGWKTTFINKLNKKKRLWLFNSMCKWNEFNEAKQKWFSWCESGEFKSIV